MARPREQRQQVREAYVVRRLTIEAAAQACDVPLSTARKWLIVARARGDDWDAARVTSSMSSAGAAAHAMQFLASFQPVHEAAMAAVQADEALSAMERVEAVATLANSYAKVIQYTAQAAPEQEYYAQATRFLTELVAYVTSTHPQHAAVLAEVVEGFGRHLAERRR